MAKDVKERTKTPVGRFFFEHLVKPRQKKAKDQEGKEYTADQWQVCMVFDVSENDVLREMKDVAGRVAEEAFGQHWKKLVEQGSIRWPFRNGGEINPNTGEPRFGEGLTYINASSNNPVEVVSRYKDPSSGRPRLLLDRRGNALDPNIGDLIYPGVYGRCGVTIASFNNESKGVTVYINTAQTMEYGERLAAGMSAEDEFADEAEDMPEADLPDDAQAEGSESLL